MKFTDVRTIKTLIKEYGMGSGSATYGSNKSVMAPSSSPSQKTSSSPTTKKTPQSPSTTGAIKKDTPKILAVRASDVPADAVVKDIKDKPMGKVVSRVGDKPKADALVVDTGKMGKQQYQVLDKNQKVFIDNPEYQEEGSAAKLISKLKIKNKKVRSIKKILRNSEGNEQNETVNAGNGSMKESIFAQFDKLSLEEQLTILERVDSTKLDEAWSKKYKDSINCSNPKGFSQEAHCDGKKKNEDVDVDENLKQWFKDKWVRFGPDGKIKGDCARGNDSEGKPKCLPQSKAHALGKDGRASAARRKRREDPNPERKGAAKNVATKKESVTEQVNFPSNVVDYLKTKGYKGPYKLKQLKAWTNELEDFESIDLDNDIMVQGNNVQFDGWVVRLSDGEFLAGSEGYASPVSVKQLLRLEEKQDACYHKVKSRYKVWPSAYASGALVQCRKKGAKNWGNSKKESVAESAVPDNRKVRILNKIMSKPLLASDLGAQMEAFFAIPDPRMVNEFRKQRAIAGDDIDLRPVVKGFIGNVLHPDVQKQVNVSESVINEYDDLGKEKQTIIKTVSGLDAADKEQASILDRIYKILNSGQISSNIDVAFTKPLVDENLPEAEKANVRRDMTRIISSLEQDYGSMKRFLDRLEQAGGVVNIAELSKPLNTFEKVFGDDAAIAAFITLANYGVGKKQKGPGEYALACLSNQIKLAEGEGDLQINGIGKTELKAALSSAGGRIGYGGGSQKAKRAAIEKYAQYLPTVLARLNAGGGGSISIRPFIDALNTDLPTNNPENVKVRKALMSELLTMDLEKFAAPVVDKFATSTNFDEIETEYLIQNFAWYKDRDDFDALLLIHVPNRKTAMIRNAEDLIAFRNSGHANATSISIVPTQAGAGREQWAQLTLNKAKAG
jgi:hypothetical protein